MKSWGGRKKYSRPVKQTGAQRFFAPAVGCQFTMVKLAVGLATSGSLTAGSIDNQTTVPAALRSLFYKQLSRALAVPFVSSRPSAAAVSAVDGVQRPGTRTRP